MKIWDVEIGDNWSSHTVMARNYVEAGRKALKLSEAPKGDKFVSEVKLARETEN